MITAEVEKVLATIADLGRQSQALADADEPERRRAADRLHSARILCEMAAFDLVTPQLVAASANNEELPF